MNAESTAVDERIETAAEMLHVRRHRAGHAAVCSACRDDAVALAPLLLWAPFGASASPTAVPAPSSRPAGDLIGRSDEWWSGYRAGCDGAHADRCSEIEAHRDQLRDELADLQQEMACRVAALERQASAAPPRRPAW